MPVTWHKTRPPNRPPPIVRQNHLDNYRTFLTVCVIFMHTAIAYGGPGTWLYRSRFYKPSTVLLASNAVISCYALGAFFFISGYLSSLSAQRKSRYDFLVDKLIRLGLPALVYTFIIAPLPIITMRLFLPGYEHQGIEPTPWQMFMDHVKSVRGVQGPPWYCATLFVFDAVYICFRRRPGGASRINHNPPQRKVSVIHIIWGLLSTITTSFFLRLYFPTTYRFPPLNLRVGSIPQWIAAYILGHAASSPSDIIEKFYVLFWPLLAVSVTCIFTLANLLSNPSNGLQIGMYAGGFNPISAVYIIWNEVTGFLIFAGLLAFFNEYCKGRWMGSGRYAYAVFLLHPPVCVAIMVLLDDLRAGGVQKTGAVGMLSVLTCWSVAWVVLRVPGVGKVV